MTPRTPPNSSGGEGKGRSTGRSKQPARSSKQPARPSKQRRAGAAKASKRPGAAASTKSKTAVSAGRPASPPRKAPPRGSARSRRPTRRRRGLILATGPFRLWSAFVVVAFVLSLFAARLIQLQGIDENDYAALAVQKGARTISLEAPRASIYDRTGEPLAQSVDAAKLTADPTYTKKNATAIATYLHQRLDLDYIETLAQLEKRGTRYVELARHLEPPQAQSIVDHLNKADLAGVYVDKDTTRVYPAGDVAANLVGFVGADNNGLAGFESSLNDELAGQDGSATFEMAGGQQLPLADTTVVEPQEGTGIRLTIDQDLQFLAQRRLAEAVRSVGGASGTAVVMDVQTGQILADADYPTYDPNNYERSPKTVYGAPSVMASYEPGSVEKVLTFASLLDAGDVTPRTQITVPSTLPSGVDTIHDWFSHGVLKLTATGAIAQSSNIATALAARQMPSAELRSYLTKFGLGSTTGVGLRGEDAGVVPPAKDWIQIAKDNIAFGQGLSVTAVQMAAAISAVANGGVYVQPSLVDGYVDHEGDFTPAAAPERHRVVSERAAEQVSRMMEEVVGENGLAPTANINGYRVAGKTGTAQRVDPACGCYRGTVVSFAGFAPADAPRFVVYVVVQQPREGSGGGTTGGPVFHDLMAAALQKYGVPPTGQTEPALPVYW